MAVAQWPVNVPFNPMASGATAGQTYTAPRRKETEGGPPIMRPHPGPRASEFAFQSKLLSGAEWSAFEQFAREDLRQGTLPFAMPVFRPDQGYVSRTCQIKDGVWSVDMSTVNKYRVSFTLVVYNW